jgi:hypothetical protein
VKSLNRMRNEKGTTVAEFAVVALLFFMIIFGIIEFGRLLYTHNALTDATRRGARFAALNPATATEAVQNEVVYGRQSASPDFDKDAATPVINGLTTDMVEVTYVGVPLNPEGTVMTGYGTNLGTATVKIEGYTFDLLIPVIGRQLTLPAYSTTLPAESAGLKPGNINAP